MNRLNHRQASKVRKIILLLTVSITFLLWLFPSLFKQADWFVEDKLIQIAMTDRSPQNIIILDIDDASLETIGAWPWSRETVAMVLMLLFEKHNPKGVGVDLIFPEAREPEGDQLLAQAIQKYPICLSVAFDLNSNNQPREVGYLTGGIVPQKNSVQGNGYVASHKALSEMASCVGHITPNVDQDGLIRTIPSAIKWENAAWLSLSHALWSYTQLDEKKEWNFPKNIRIPYRIQPRKWKTVPVQDLLLQNISRDYFDESYVLIGSSAIGLSDRVATPIDPWLPGVVIHAEILDGIMNPKTLNDTLVQSVTILYAMTAICVLFYSFSRFQPETVIIISILLIIIWLGLAYLFTVNQCIFSPALPIMGLLFMLVLQTPYEWLVVHRQNRRMAKLLRGYLSENVANQILDSDRDILEPQLRTITVLFADIEGFTKMAEQLETAELAKLTVEVLTILTDEVHACDGTLDKYIGDAVMAFWNAPLAQPNHAQLAVSSALSMLERLKKFNLQNQHWPNIHIRIGINTGEAMVGDLGTLKRHAYTAIGEVVNDAHRLHEKSKAYQTHLLISQETYKQLIDKNLPPEIKVAQPKSN